MEEYKFVHLDQEHEQEINLKNEEFENVINKLEKERLLNQGEISSLTNDKNILDSNEYYFYCPVCNSLVEKEFNFCKKCGVKIDWS